MTTRNLAITYRNLRLYHALALQLSRNLLAATYAICSKRHNVLS